MFEKNDMLSERGNFRTSSCILMSVCFGPKEKAKGKENPFRNNNIYIFLFEHHEMM